MNARRRLLVCASFSPFAALFSACGQGEPSFHATDLGKHDINSELLAKMRDFHGRPWNLADFRGKIVILFFGYTSCPDICPTALAKYADLLKQPGLGADKVQVVFVTLDPERDTPERLADYIPWFHPSFLALSADQSIIDEIARNFRVVAQRKEIPGKIGYVFDHSAGAYVYGPDGRLRLYLTENARLSDISDDLQLLLQGR